MSDGYELTPSDVRAHAKEVARFADDIREAKASASDPMAHGVIGYAWGQAMTWWCDDAHDFVDRAAAKADAVARELGGMAYSYEDAEQDAVRNLRQAGGDAP